MSGFFKKNPDLRTSQFAKRILGWEVLLNVRMLG